MLAGFPLGAEARLTPTMHCGPKGDCNGSCPSYCEHCTCDQPWCVCSHYKQEFLNKAIFGQMVELKQEPSH